MYILSGFLALGSFLDGVANAISLLTPLVASIGTACIVLVCFLMYIILPRYPLPRIFGNQLIRVRKPGIQPMAFAVGMVLLLWLPSILTPWQTPPVSEAEKTRLAKELGVTESALKSFFKILDQQHVPPEDLDSTLRDIAKRYKDLQEKLQTFTSDDPAVVALKQAASKALNAGDFAQAEKLLNEASQKDLEGAQQFHEMATKRWLSAAASKVELGILKETQLRYAEAAVYYHQAVELVDPIPEGSEATLATYLNNWARALWRAGDYTNAESPQKRALAIREQVLGPTHPDVAQSFNNLALLYYAQGQYAKAEPLYQRALAIAEQVLGPTHPDVATGLNNLAALYHAQGRYAEAEPLYQRALAIGEETLGRDHPTFKTILKNYLALLHDTNRQTEPEQ
jgi:tetratricopeptide (TPR) repeat protein